MNNPTTKSKIIDAVVASTDLTRTQATTAFESIFSTIGQALVSGSDVTIRAFGTLKVTLRAERKARDIARGTTILIPAHYVIKYVPGTAIKSVLALQRDLGIIAKNKNNK